MLSKVVPVSSIKVANRIRKEFGDIDSLAEDIRENGLINPVTLTPDGKLLAGERRLRAVKSLGWDEVDARIVEDADDVKQLSIEISENDNRKEFTFSERQDYIKLLHKMFDAEAKKRQVAGLKHVGNSSLAQHCANEKVSEKIGEALGICARTVEKAEYVADHATPEMIAALDAEQLSINAAYKQLRDQARKAEEENRSLTKSLEEARANAKREKAAKNQLEREEDEASEKMEQLQQKVWELEELLEEAKKQPANTEEYDALMKKYERTTTLLKQNTETMLETEKAIDALRNSSGIKRAGLVVEACDKIATIAFELDEFDNDDFASMDPMTRSEITMTMTNTIHTLENLRSAVQSAERKTA